MRPEALQRALIQAVAFGDTADEQHLRRQLRGIAHVGAADYLRATTLVCLAHRFGEPAPPGGAEADRVDPPDRPAFGHLVHRGLLDRERPAPAIGDDELGRFMAELRAAGPLLRPPRNFLEVEAVIRGLYGEPHMLEEIGAKQQHEALAFLLRYLTDSIPEIRECFEAVIDQAQALQRFWIIG